MFSCRMVGLLYELALVSRPEKDVLYPPFNLNAFGNPQGRVLSFYHPGNATDWLCDGRADETASVASTTKSKLLHLWNAINMMRK